MNAKHPAVFLDRDGVIIREVHLLTDAANIQVLPGVPGAMRKLKQAGFQIVIVSNQTVISRGLLSEIELTGLNRQIEDILVEEGAPHWDGCYVCPHHPKATVPAYRIDCECRKPKPGMLLQAAHEHDLDLTASFMVGDRITDVIAGYRAGCRTILLTTGAHDEPPIETTEPIDASIKPDFTCATLEHAANWILKKR